MHGICHQPHLTLKTWLPMVFHEWRPLWTTFVLFQYYSLVDLSIFIFWCSFYFHLCAQIHHIFMFIFLLTTPESKVLQQRDYNLFDFIWFWHAIFTPERLQYYFSLHLFQSGLDISRLTLCWCISVLYGWSYCWVPQISYHNGCTRVLCWLYELSFCHYM